MTGKRVTNVPTILYHSRISLGNYRPVTLTTVPDKLTETLLKNRIRGYADKYDTLGKFDTVFVMSRDDPKYFWSLLKESRLQKSWTTKSILLSKRHVQRSFTGSS